jgi:hypothetical protein
MPKWQGPAKITEINDTNAHILLPTGKTKIINVMLVKQFFAPEQDNSEPVQNSDLNFNSEESFSGSVTRAMKKLINHKNAAQMDINILCDLSKEHCFMCEWEQDVPDNPLLFNP